MVGLGLTRLEPLRSYAASTVSSTATGGAPGPASGPYSIDSVRALAVEAARAIGDGDLADELSEVCCWAPAAAAIRKRPLTVQAKGAEHFFRDFPGGERLADVLVYANNTSWQKPQFRFDPDHLVAKHYAQLQRPQNGARLRVLDVSGLNGAGRNGELGLLLDRATGDRLAKTADRGEPMWAALSLFSGIMLDPTDELSRRLSPRLSLTKANDRALARTASVRYSQIVLGAVQRAVWADLLDGADPAMPLVQLSASGYLPLGEEQGDFYLLRVGDARYLTGYRSSNA